MTDGQALNTDRELYREPDKGGGDFYSDSIHVTERGGIGINRGGTVYIKSLREWHRLAEAAYAPSAECVLASDPASRQSSGGSRSIRLGATEIAANLVEAWHTEFFGLRIADWKLGELQRRIATALVSEPATNADLALADRYADEIIELREANEQLRRLVLELNRRLVLVGVDPRADAEPNCLEGPQLAAPATTPNSGFDSRDGGRTKTAPT